MFDFSYLIDKINSSEFEDYPFPHIHVNNFLSEDHFDLITSSDEVYLGNLNDDKQLFDKLLGLGWYPIKFPGCTDSVDEYLNWRVNRDEFVNVDTCEGFGMALRLKKPQSLILKSLKDFIESSTFQETLANKFGINFSLVYPDVGIQKYLDGYEISPHPDIRKKALTFMVNINPAKNSEEFDYHTHYLTFKPEKLYVQEFWKHNVDYDRSWVPWDWCISQKQQSKNNSIIIFMPSFNTIHAVKAAYDHLLTQRTQLYGNLWYGKRDFNDVRDGDIVTLPQIPWQGLLIDESRGTNHLTNNTSRSYITRLINKSRTKFSRVFRNR